MLRTSQSQAQLLSRGCVYLARGLAALNKPSNKEDNPKPSKSSGLERTTEDSLNPSYLARTLGMYL